MSFCFRAVAGRFRRVFLGLALLCTVLPASAARLALVIGVDSYENVTRLKNARADAESMAAALTRAGYEVQLRTDRKLKDLQADLRDFRARIRGGDEVILFFSGHGVQLGGTNYLLPADVGSESEDQVRDEAVALSRALEDLRAQKPRFTLAIIDACRDNPFAGKGRAIGGRGLTGVAGATGQMVIYAAGEGQQALDRLGRNDTARNGVFTRVFLEEMQRPGVPINEVVRNVRERVYELAVGVSREQVPAIYDQTLGRFYFYPPVPGATSPPALQPQPSVASSVRKVGEVFKDCDVCPELVVIGPGSFLMGSPTSEKGRGSDEGPAHPVTIGYSLGVGRFEVTQGEWKALMGSNPSGFKDCGDRCPVEHVSWEDVQGYLRKLSEKTGKKYRLLSESEWEYTARAGTMGRFSTGDQITPAQANFNASSYNGSAKGEYRGKTLKVGSFSPNAFGLYDMHGNVREWVEDAWHDNYWFAPADGAPRSGWWWEVRRVLRGGSWFSPENGLTSSSRTLHPPGTRYSDIGFRVARSLAL